MKDKVCALLGFASKAGALRLGAANAIEAVRRRQANCVFFAEDISAKSRKEIAFYCGKYNVGAFELKGIDMQRLSNAVGKKCGVAALTDENFKTPLISNLTSDIRHLESGTRR